MSDDRASLPSAPPRRRRTALAVLALLLPVAGCVDRETPVPEAGPPALRTEAVKLDPEEVSHRISAYRQAHDLTAVTLDPALVAIAQAQATAMATSATRWTATSTTG